MSGLNGNSPIPLYRQLAAHLQQRIERGDFVTGARIPSEPQLSQSFGVGRPTVRQATDFLERRGLIERRRGSGTFVRPRPNSIDLLSLGGTMASFERDGIKAEFTVASPLALRTIRHANNPFHGQQAFHIRRLSSIAGTPVLLEDLFFEPNTFPSLDRLGVDAQSISKLVGESFFLRPSQARQTFRIRNIEPDEAKLLALGTRDVALEVARRLSFSTAHNALFALMLCRTDQFAFSQTIQLDSEPQGTNHA